ncbi:ScbA/BarX family gamma-butyrolactone biosynthesis protein [Streptomyces sp. NPDC046727]|uniref:ScbA/BarX family gamma-butyrolactone biosynthesis protein n=1 Tax=Streptomyces sp. NPDC046727 TaxID=3155373 RepID=UPI0033D34D55
MSEVQQGNAGIWTRPDGLAERLTFQRTVPRHLVHRASVAEVFLTDALALGDDRFLVGAQWPRDHALYHPDALGRSDPLLAAETVRQALVYLAHWHYAIPLDRRFVGRRMELDIAEPQALRVTGRPLHVVLQARWEWVDSRPPHRHGMRLEAELVVDGRRIGRGSLHVVALDERRYGVLRRRTGGSGGPVVPVQRRRTLTLPAARVGRLRGKDSVLAATRRAGEWELHADLDHAVLFDHPTDHVPLMVLLEGVRQLGHVLTSRPGEREGQPAVASQLTSLSIDCLAFAELNSPVRLLVTEDRTAPCGTRQLAIDAVQDDRGVAAVTARWHHDETPLSAAGPSATPPLPRVPRQTTA